MLSVFGILSNRMGVVAISLVFGFISYFLLKFIVNFRKLQALRIEGPNIYPPLIEFFYPTLKLSLSSAQQRFEIIAEYCWKFPDLLKIWIGTGITIFVSHPEKIQKVLMSQKCLEKWNLFYGLMERDAGLISASHRKKWKEHRKFFNSSFSFKILESFTPIFVEHSKILCRNLSKEVGSGREFDFSVYSKRISFDILCATSLGTNTNDLRNDKVYEKIFEAYET
jgi:hypothetical protein